ncbi:hypothetical protein L1049_024607 [Liquidambar formosana]|uniref:BSD domain-containing protein n=1 Tax=Liquidambar formosana TaxID=63359 RepID=A0AAP0WYM9_LIQFO
MSWLARSIVNSLKLDDDDEDDAISNSNGRHTESPPKPKPEDEHHHTDSSPSESPSGRGVKEDLSELTKSLTRQIWGVASFLAPPPSPQISDSNRAELSDQSPPSSDSEIPDAAGIAGIRSDFAEIGGKFKTGISKLSSNKAVSEITKIASNFLQFGSDQDPAADEDSVAVGVTDEVLVFARNIAMHPETWMDFPLPDDEDSDDFDMSDAQQEHALAVERLAPRLAALRMELCPGYMSEDCFWNIYFVLLHPRLSKHDAELLSTPQIVEARAMLMQELQSRSRKPEAECSGKDASYLKETAITSHEECLSVPSGTQSESVPLKTAITESSSFTRAADFETEKHPVSSTDDIRVIDKSIIEEGPVNETKYQNSFSGSSSRVMDEKSEDDGDDWLKEESAETGGISGTSIPLGNDEDVSFSDLEDDDGDAPMSDKKVTYSSDSSTKDSRDWVQLSRSSDDSAKDINSVSSEPAGSEQVRGRNPESKESNDWLNVDDIDVI